MRVLLTTLLNITVQSPAAFFPLAHKWGRWLNRYHQSVIPANAGIQSTAIKLVAKRLWECWSPDQHKRLSAASLIWRLAIPALKATAGK
jgi:hypothetical protein